MAFKLRSGNKPQFKTIGSSPLRLPRMENDEANLVIPNTSNNQSQEAKDLAEKLKAEELHKQKLQEYDALIEKHKKTNTSEFTQPKTTLNQRTKSGQTVKGDKEAVRAGWWDKQKNLNTMAWNKGGTGDYLKDRWSGSRVGDLKFSFWDAIMGDDIQSGFSTKKGGGSRRSNRGGGGGGWAGGGGGLFGPPGGGTRNRGKKITRKDMTQCTIGNASPECDMG